MSKFSQIIKANKIDPENLKYISLIKILDFCMMS